MPKARALAVTLILFAACETPRQVCDPGTDKCRPDDGWNGLAPLVRGEHLQEVTPVAGIEVVSVPSGAAGWQLNIRNTGDEPITFVLDDSHFVMSEGTTSNIVRAELRGVAAVRAQPAEPIAAHATWAGTVTVSKLMRAEDIERRVPELERSIHASSDPQREGAKADERHREVRAEIARLVIGGTLSLALQRSSGTQMWTATVVGKN